MVQWTSPAEIAKDYAAYTNVVFACFGIYAWEILQTSDYELAVFKRQRKLGWQSVLFFFICRYMVLFSVAGLMATVALRSPTNCQALYTFVCVAGNLSIMCGTTTLMLRTVEIWERKKMVWIPLTICVLGQSAILWRGMFIFTAEYDPATMSCVIATTQRVFLAATYFTTTGVNLIIFGYTVFGLMHRDNGASFWEMLFRDGLILYIIAFSCNALPAVFTAINLNSVMNLIATVPAAVLSAMAACRTVTRLPPVDNDDDLFVHTATQLTAPPTPRATRFPKQSVRVRPTANRVRPEVHVTTDHIVMEDFTVGAGSPPDSAFGMHTDDKPFELAADDKSDHRYDAV